MECKEFQKYNEAHKQGVLIEISRNVKDEITLEGLKAAVGINRNIVECKEITNCKTRKIFSMY